MNGAFNYFNMKFQNRNYILKTLKEHHIYSPYEIFKFVYLSLGQKLKIDTVMQCRIIHRGLITNSFSKTEKIQRYKHR